MLTGSPSRRRNWESETQVYDAAMLIGYASMLQMKNRGMSFREAMRQLVSGREDVDSFWGADGMLRVTRSLAAGGHPCIQPFQSEERRALLTYERSERI